METPTKRPATKKIDPKREDHWDPVFESPGFQPAIPISSAMNGGATQPAVQRSVIGSTSVIQRQATDLEEEDSPEIQAKEEGFGKEGGLSMQLEPDAGMLASTEPIGPMIQRSPPTVPPIPPEPEFREGRDFNVDNSTSNLLVGENTTQRDGSGLGVMAHNNVTILRSRGRVTPGAISIQFEVEDATTCCIVQFLWHELQLFDGMGAMRRKPGIRRGSSGSSELTTDPASPKWSLDSKGGAACHDTKFAAQRTSTSVTIYDRPGSNIALMSDADRASSHRARSQMHFASFLVCGGEVQYVVNWISTQDWTPAAGANNYQNTIVSSSRANDLPPELKSLVNLK